MGGLAKFRSDLYELMELGDLREKKLTARAA
jgi:hypothetical protein